MLKKSIAFQFQTPEADAVIPTTERRQYRLKLFNRYAEGIVDLNISDNWNTFALTIT